MPNYFSLRMRWALSQLPQRWLRLGKALIGLRPTTLRGVSQREWSVSKAEMRIWRLLPLHFVMKCVEIPLLLSECLLLTDLIAVSCIIFQPQKFRPLHDEALQMGVYFYGENINWSLLRCCDSSRVAKKRGIAFVVFSTIYFDTSLPMDVWIHELMHIYQYQHYGSTYIPRALQAQRTREGYNYGTFSTFENLHELNAEQQAELMQDYCRLQQGLRTQQVNYNPDVIAYKTVLRHVLPA